VFPYLTCPEAGDVERALCAFEFLALREWLRTRLEKGDEPELRHILGLLDYFYLDFARADEELEAAFRAFRHAGRPRAAALVAISLGRLHFDGIGNQAVGRGWLARARSLVEAEPACVEQGWAALGLVGCSVDDTSELEADAMRALELSRSLDDIELECKALADLGLALVSLGKPSEGMARLDEAMTMLRSRECVNPIVVSQVCCDLLSACERIADLPRAEAWLQALESMRFVNPPDRKPSFLFTHCRIEYGRVLCDIGRWTEAEAALRVALATSGDSGRNHRVGSRAALADLWIQQGRLAAAASLLDGFDDRIEAALPSARLQLARGKPEQAAAIARQGLRVLGGDRVRAAPILAILIDAELQCGNVDEARRDSERLDLLAQDVETAGAPALAARARGHLAGQRGDTKAAVSAYEDGLREIGGGWPLLRGALHLDLAAAHEHDRAAAIAEARSALAIYRRLDAPGATAAVAMLRRLGASVPGPDDPRPTGPLSVLSPREREVFELVAQGHSNPEIGRRLFITPKTVEHHVTSILSKLGLRSRMEIVVYAAGGATVPD
jgi:DNA-binding CsgD family transcriptional regulator/tetratricopeptide (TPR) repeat protein